MPFSFLSGIVVGNQNFTDTLLGIGYSNSGDNVDLGFYGQYTSGSLSRYAGLIRVAGGDFYLFDTSQTPQASSFGTSVTTSLAHLHVGTLTCDNIFGTFSAGSITGMLKATAGVVAAAVAGSDYEGPISAGTTSQYWRGDKSWQTLDSDAVAEGKTNLYFTAFRAADATASLYEPLMAVSSSTQYWRGDKTWAILNTDACVEGTTNQYFTTARARAAFSGAGYVGITDGSISVSGLEPTISAATPSPTLKYWRGDKSWQTLTSDVVTEGSTNLYFTTARARASITASGYAAIDGSGNITVSGLEPAFSTAATTTYFRGDKSWQTLDTSVVTEGTNLYFTTARARDSISVTSPLTYVDGVIGVSLGGVYEPAIASGSVGQYWKHDKTWATLDTAAVAENVANLYFTNARARSALSVTGSYIAYNSSTGAFSISGLEPTISAGSSGQYWKHDKTWATLNQAAVSGLTTSDTPQFLRLGVGTAADATAVIKASGYMMLGMATTGTLRMLSTASGTRNNIGIGIYNVLGQETDLVTDNICIGRSSLNLLGSSLGAGSYNCCIGQANLGYATSASYNCCMGSDMMAGFQSGCNYNTGVGTGCFRGDTTLAPGVNLNATYNVAIGYETSRQLTTGIGNTSIGSFAGRNVFAGQYNVFIGYQAGMNETGSNKLYIANTSTASPLIYGDFSTGALTINGTIYGTSRAGIGTASATDRILNLGGTISASFNAFGVVLAGTIGSTSTGNNAYGIYTSPTYSCPTSMTGNVYSMQIDAGSKTGSGTPTVGFGLHCVAPSVSATSGLGIYTDSLGVGAGAWASKANATGQVYILNQLSLGAAPLSYMGIRQGGTLTGAASTHVYGYIMGQNMTVSTTGYSAYYLSVGSGTTVTIPAGGGYGIWGLVIDGANITKSGGSLTFGFGAQIISPNVTASGVVGVGTDSLVVSSTGNAWTDRSTATGCAYISSGIGIGVFPSATDRMLYVKATQTYASFITSAPVASSGTVFHYCLYPYLDVSGLTGTSTANWYGIYSQAYSSSARIGSAYGGYFANPGLSTTAANNLALYADDLCVGGISGKQVGGIYTSGNARIDGLTASALVYTSASKVLTSATVGSSMSFSGGALNTIQAITTSSTPQFDRLALGTSLPANGILYMAKSLIVGTDVYGFANLSTVGISGTTGVAYHSYMQPMFNLAASSTSTIYGLYIEGNTNYGFGVGSESYTLRVKAPAGSTALKVSAYLDDCCVGGASSGNQVASGIYSSGGIRLGSGNQVMSVYKEGTVNCTTTYNAAGSTTLTITYVQVGKLVTITIPQLLFTGDNTNGITINCVSPIIPNTNGYQAIISSNGGTLQGGYALVSAGTSKIILYPNSSVPSYRYSGANSGIDTGIQMSYYVT